jgi:hypothetical protein
MTLDDERNRSVEQEILQAIRSIRYGSVEIVIHDSKVVQIERKEKVRFAAENSSKGR